MRFPDRSRSRLPSVIVLAWAAACAPACGSSGHPADAADAKAPGDAPAEATPSSGAAGGTAGAGPGSAGGSAGGASAGAGADAAPDRAVDAVAEVGSDAGADVTSDADAGPPPASGTPWRALAITTGIVHACALLDNHQIKCWGPNSFGCLGTGDPDNRGQVPEKMGNALPFVDLGVGRTATAIAAGRYTTCAILDTGAVKCWGWWTNTGEPKTVAGDDGQVGNAPGELGDALPPLDLGPGRKAVHIASGYLSTCAVLDDGTARCWADGPIAPEPLEPALPVRQLAPARSRVLALFEDGSLSSLLPKRTATGVSVVLGAGQKATYIAGSELGVCAVLDDGHLACTENTLSALALSSTSDAVAVDVAEHHTCVLTRSGDVRCWGLDCGDYPVGARYACSGKALADGSFTVALGQPATALGMSAIDFSCAVLADGGVKCWERASTCTNAGGVVCPIPAQTTPIVGGAVAITGTGNARKFGAWRAIDLGTRP